MTLINRIILIAAAGFAAALVLLSLLFYIYFWPALKEFVIEQQREGAQLVVRQIDQAITERSEAMEHLATMVHDGSAFLSHVEVQRLFDQRILLHKYFNGGILLLDQRGVIRVDSPIHPGRVGVDLSDRDYLAQAREQKSTLLTPPLIGRGLQTPVFIVVVPIVNDHGRVDGFLYGVTRLADENLFQKIGDYSMSRRGRLYIVDTNLDLIVTASDPTLAYRTASETPVAGVLASIASGFSSGIAYEHGFAHAGSDPITSEKVLFATVAMPGLNWQVVRTIDYRDAMAPLYALVVPLILFFLLLFGLVTLIVVLLLRRQLEPLRSTAETINAMVDRQIPTRPLPVKSFDEVGRLLLAFNSLNELRNRLEAERQIFEEQRRRSLFTLLVNIAHQWRQPLNIIGLQAQQIFDEYEAGELSERSLAKQVQGIMVQLQSLSAIITRFTRLHEHGSLAERVAFRQLIGEVEVLMSRRIEESQLKLLVEVDDLLELEVAPADVVELLLQLFDNTITAARQRGRHQVELRIGALIEPAEGEGGFARVVVEDDAGGFDERLLANLFDPYSSDGYREANRGLGLFQVEQIVRRRYGGQISASNSVRGARVEFTLPLAEEKQIG